MNYKIAQTKKGRWLGVMVVLVLALVLVVPASAGYTNDHIGGLVYIDANGNGVWDEGEEGYGGYEGVAKEEGEWVHRYFGANVTFTPIGSGPVDPIVLESAPYREMEDHEKDGDTCTRQDLEKSLDNGHYPAQRPCEGSFGMISWANDVTWEVSIEVPDGYEMTSEPVLRFSSSEDVPMCDFGIAPIASK
jgi:hypothetical protein